MSGAMIRISKSDDPNTSPSTERQIMITGNGDSVALAKSLINMSLDLHKASLERAKTSDDEDADVDSRRGRGGGSERLGRGGGGYYEPPMSGLAGTTGHLASLLSKPDVLAAVNILGQLGGIGGAGAMAPLNQVGAELAESDIYNRNLAFLPRWAEAIEAAGPHSPAGRWAAAEKTVIGTARPRGPSSLLTSRPPPPCSPCGYNLKIYIR